MITRITNNPKTRKPKRPFYPTLYQVKHWFTVLNKKIFNNKLHHFATIEIGRTKVDGDEVWAYIEQREEGYFLRVSNKHPNFVFFLSVLGHEMVHMYQMEYVDGDSGLHNESFYQWKEKFTKHGLVLKALM